MGRLRFGVAFAVTDRKMEERLPRRGEETEEGKLGGCKGKLSGIRHSGQSDKPTGQKAKRMPEGKTEWNIGNTHRNC